MLIGREAGPGYAPSRRTSTPILPAGTITPVFTDAPTGTTAVLVNLTMINGVGDGYITADKCSTLTSGPQYESSGNHSTGAAIANLSVVPIDSDGSFCIYNQNPVSLVVDEQGFFGSTSGLNFSALGPSRIFDSRDIGVRSPGSITRIITGAPAGTAAVLVNLTMVAPSGASASGYITADKCSTMKAGPQTKSSGNYSVDPVANLAVVSVDPDGSFCINNQQRVNLVVDIQGTFSAAGTDQFFPVGPVRVADTRT